MKGFRFPYRNGRADPRNRSKRRISVRLFQARAQNVSLASEWNITMTVENASAEHENQFHTYTSHVIPWYVRLIWIGFWIFTIAYSVKYFLPAIQTELLNPP